MKRKFITMILVVVIAFYWALPARTFALPPRFDHPVIMAISDDPDDRWFISPQPLQLCSNERRSTATIDSSDNEPRPAWASFAVAASWSLMLIADRTERTALGTLALIDCAAPLMFFTAAVLASLALDTECDSAHHGNDDTDPD